MYGTREGYYHRRKRVGNPTSMLYMTLIFAGAYIIGMSGYVLVQSIRKFLARRRKG